MMPHLVALVLLNMNQIQQYSMENYGMMPHLVAVLILTKHEPETAVQHGELQNDALFRSSQKLQEGNTWNVKFLS